MARILIVGGGFAGLTAAERLAGALDAEAAAADEAHEVTLLAPSRRFVFYPGLVRVAFGRAEPEDLTFDLNERSKTYDFRFIEGEALDVNTQTRHVRVGGADFSGEIAYDYLVIAVGRRLATEKVGGFFEHSHHLLGVKAAQRFREAVRQFGGGQAVVGLCPDGRLPVPACETAFALARTFEDDIRAGRVSLKIVFPEGVEQAFGGAAIHRELLAAFGRHGIETVTDFPIREVSGTAVISEGGAEIEHDLLALVPPFRGQTIVHNLADDENRPASDDSGFALVNDRMQVRGLPGVYAAGDIVAFSGPKLAHMAIRQAVVAAENVLAEIKGAEPQKAYYHEIASIIDQGGPDSIYLHYGIWDDALYELKRGRFWSWAKEIHDGLWQSLRA